MNLFFNNDRRLRAGWRLATQYIIMSLCVGGLTMLVYNYWGSSSRLLLTMSSFVGITFSVWVSARVLDHRPFQDYGLQVDRKWVREFFAGTFISALAISFIFWIEWQLGWLTITGYGWDIVSAGAFSKAFLSYLLIMLMVGFHEELFSRGYQVLNVTEGLSYPKIGARGAVIIAVLTTSAIFGFLHLNNPNASIPSTVNIILAGVVLAVPFILTGSLALSVGLHFGWNFFQGGVWGFPVSGLEFDSSVIHIQQQGAPLWTGGNFGPEAGLLGLTGMAIMLGASYVYILQAGYEPAIAEIFRKEEIAAMKSDEQAA